MRVSASFALRLSLSDWFKKLVQSAPTNQNKLIVSGDWSTSLFPPAFHELREKRGGLMVSALDSGASGPGSKFWPGTLCCSWENTLLSQCLSPPRAGLFESRLTLTQHKTLTEALFFLV